MKTYILKTQNNTLQFKLTYSYIFKIILPIYQ